MTIHTFDKKKFVFVDVSMMNHTGDDVLVAVRNAMRVGFDTQKDEAFLRGSNKVHHPHEVSTAFGPHLTFRGQLSREQMSMDWFYEFLEVVPREIGMTPISTPTVIKPQRVDGQRGWDGVAIIAESHIALHADPNGHYYLDIFSCKAFDTDQFLNLVRSMGLQIDDSSIALTARGKNFPRDERHG
jgi:S-adenosylmethionine/arginine decarboxylase-like enzyme